MEKIGTVKQRAANTFKVTLKHVSRASLDCDNEDSVTEPPDLIKADVTSSLNKESNDTPSSKSTPVNIDRAATRNLLNYWKDKEREVLESLKNVYKPRLHQLNVSLRNPHLMYCEADIKFSTSSSDLDACSDISSDYSGTSRAQSLQLGGDGDLLTDSICEPVLEIVHPEIKQPPSTEQADDSGVNVDSQPETPQNTEDNSSVCIAQETNIDIDDVMNESFDPSQPADQVTVIQTDDIEVQISPAIPSPSTDNLNVLSTVPESSPNAKHDSISEPPCDPAPSTVVPSSNDISPELSLLSPLLDVINQQIAQSIPQEPTTNAENVKPASATAKKGGLRKRDPDRIKTVGTVRFEAVEDEPEETVLRRIEVQETIIEENPMPIPTQCVFVDVNPETTFIKDKLLGRGRYGQVYKCVSRDSSNPFEVAGKFIRAGRTEIKKGVESEVRILQALDNHPQLIRFHSVYYMKREIAIFTELVGGGELFERIANSTEDTLTEPMVIKFVRQILSGIEYMHRKKIIHRDLKPENILCKSPTSYDIKIIDFGFATFIEDGAAPPKQLAGTTVFMAPETIKFEPQGYYTDIWSVGVIAYNLLCGFTPFEKPPPNHPRPNLTDQEILVNIEKGQYDFDDEEFRNTSKSAKDFINQLLQVSPKKRPSASECLQHEWFRERKIQRNTPKISRQVSLNRVRALVYLKKAAEASALKKFDLTR